MHFLINMLHVGNYLMIFIALGVVAEKALKHLFDINLLFPKYPRERLSPGQLSL